MAIKLSVLDQSPIHDDKEPKEGLSDTLKLAKECEKLGYYRYWCAEHHDTPGYASASPEIMVGAIAANTSKIRVGSGGVMLNHYSSYKVAENFNSLNAIYGDRIDVGIGRAPGGAFLSTRALNNSYEKDYPQKAKYLRDFLDGTVHEDDYFNGVNISPKQDVNIPVYLLGSSDGSSSLASKLGTGFCLALFIGNYERPVNIIKSYKKNFKPSKNFKEPKAMLAVACICADSLQKAKDIASSHTYWKVEAAMGTRKEGFQSPKKVEELYEKLPYEGKVYFHETMDNMILGTPKECKEKIETLAKKYDVDEVIVVNVTYSFKDRINSYRLLAKEFNL